MATTPLSLVTTLIPTGAVNVRTMGKSSARLQDPGLP